MIIDFPDHFILKYLNLVYMKSIVRNGNSPRYSKKQQHWYTEVLYSR